MAPKQQPICKLGKPTQTSSGKWRAVLKIDGKWECGPTRSEKSIAEADLELARKASNKNDMAACLRRLKHEAATAKEHAAGARAEDAKMIKEMKKQNAAKDEELAALQETNAAQQIEISCFKCQIRALEEANANKQREIGSLKNQCKKVKTKCESASAECERFRDYAGRLPMKLSPKFLINMRRAAPEPERESAIGKPAQSSRETNEE